ncbi:MAG: DegT/DnrJ/EryC1/StrS family aminotransferase [Bacilli bacterium]|nr:DegT/DnrJ/EryC1/StrS family aminotransferase [Bacilli bacterium]
MRVIKFSPPDITEKEIDLVVESLRSGWITTGPKTKFFEKKLSEYCNTNKTVCLNSATAAMELTLHLLGIGQGDEVITSAYTYTASASVIHHVGAKIILIDTHKDSLEMDYEQLTAAINEKTKAVIPVDIAGIMCNYSKILEIVEKKRSIFIDKNQIQKAIGRIVIIADAAHSFGATIGSVKNGNFADFTCFSFHAVKNLTTAEGGAVTWSPKSNISDEYIYKQYQLLSLHGQDKDALTKTKLGTWEYDIIYPAYKSNMTDIVASIGIAQLDRYDTLIHRRKEIYNQYLKELSIDDRIQIVKHENSSFHLLITRVKYSNISNRNKIIELMAEKGIPCNVHYKPLPLMTAYKNLGFEIQNYPNAFDFFQNEITLPLHTLLSEEDVSYICLCFRESISFVLGDQ